ncbi:MAG: IclR family transcriptional regulator [Pseudomonadota bacterium]
MAGAVERVLDILDLLGSGKPMDVEQVAQALDLPASSAYRLLRTLRERHLVFQPPGSTTYQIGLAVVRWAETARECLDLVGLARPSMQALAKATQETITLTLLHGDCAVTADVIEGQGHVRVAPERGRMLSLHSGAACKAILAFLPPDFVPRDLGLPSGPRRTRSAASLRSDLASTRERGYAISVEEVYEGASAVAVPIFLAGLKPVGSLAMSAPVARLNEKRQKQVAALLLSEAGRLNTLLSSTAQPARPRGSRAAKQSTT